MKKISTNVTDVFVQCQGTCDIQIKGLNAFLDFQTQYLSLNVYFMYNINIFEHIQDMYLLHYHIIQWDREESQMTHEVRLPVCLQI